MKSRFPVAFGFIVLVLAAFWYDSTFAAPTQAAVHTRVAARGAGVALAP